MGTSHLIAPRRSGQFAQSAQVAGSRRFRYDRPAMAVHLMPVQLGEAWLAVPAEKVQEILGERPWVALPSASPELPGVLAWRGRALAVLDLGRASGVGEPLAEGTARRRTMVVEEGACTLAVPIDGVREVHSVAEAQLRPPVATRMRFSAGEVEIDGTPMPVLDVAALVGAVAARHAE